MAAPVVIVFPDSDTSDTTLTGSGKFSPQQQVSKRKDQVKLKEGIIAFKTDLCVFQLGLFEKMNGRAEVI